MAKATSLSDEALIELIIKDDQELFGEIVKRYQDKLERYIVRLGSSREQSQDIVQDTFIKSFKNLRSFNTKLKFSSWIYRIAHNHLANHYRDSKPQVDIDDVAYSLQGDDGREVMERVEDSMHLEEGLDQLSAEDRNLVTMKYLLGYSYKDMASALEKSSDALKVATHRAMKKLRVIMEQPD